METPSLGPWTFRGEVTPAHERRTSIVGEALFDGVIGWAAWPRDDVSRLLPPELALASPVAGSLGHHPLLIAMGRQHDGAVLYGGVRFDVAIAYDECLLGVPFVRRAGATQLHTFVALMLSGDRRATWSGNTHYGFAKRGGTCERFGDVVTGVAENDGVIMSAAVHSTGDWRAGATDTSLATKAIPRLFDAPVIGRRADGRYVATYFTWNLDDAMVRRVGLRLLLAPSVGLGSGGADVPAEAGIEVRGMRWCLGWPEQPLF